jgi:muramidase (phage lysozyme)
MLIMGGTAMSDTNANLRDDVPLTPPEVPEGASASKAEVGEEGNSSSATSTVPQSAKESAPTGSLVVRVTDEKGWPVSKLCVRVTNKSVKPEAILFEGVTGKDGDLVPIEGLPVGTRFEVSVKRDSGAYKFAAIGRIAVPSEHCGNLCIPRTRFEFATYDHQGAPGQHQAKRQDLTQRQPSESLKTPNPSLNPAKKPTVQAERNEAGQPVSLVSYGLPNMWGLVKAGTAAQPRLVDAQKVKALIDFAMEQVTWSHPRNQTSAAIIKKMQQGQYTPEKRTGDDPGRGYSQTRGLCTKYVKIALWRSGFVACDSDFAPTVSLARDLGPALEHVGFKNVTSEIPDARWSAPGDIIIYQRLGDPEAAGHVDIRSYDGYISDFYDNYLPVTGFKVMGVYRKYFDPLPEARMKALLKVIRSREAETVFLNQGDAAAYKALPLSAKKGLTFDDFATHPFFNSPPVPSTASGAYGINLTSWRSNVDESFNPKPWVPLKQGEPKFSPVVQDRIAAVLMESHPRVGFARNGGKTALGLLRSGDFEGAAKLLATVKPYQWPSLPGGSQSKYSAEQMKTDFERYLAEYSR